MVWQVCAGRGVSHGALRGAPCVAGRDAPGRNHGAQAFHLVKLLRILASSRIDSASRGARTEVAFSHLCDHQVTEALASRKYVHYADYQGRVSRFMPWFPRPKAQ